jgi:regulator of sirC expression with transglutaminase-like and TPR domain
MGILFRKYTFENINDYFNLKSEFLRLNFHLVIIQGRINIIRFPLIIVVGLICWGSQCVIPSSYSSHDKSSHSLTVFDIKKMPEADIDIGRWALIIAKEYDKSVDIEKYLHNLDEMVVEIKKMLAGRNSDMEKFLAVKMYIYEPGIWNNYHPYTYDLDDPLGTKREHQLLSYYMDTRKGNCVSMPTLILALMERLDKTVPFVGVKAPMHLFCRLKDRQTNDVWNVEATNGGEPARNQWYIDQMKINPKAVKSGLYLKDLSKKEYIAELLGALISKERHNGNIEKALEYTDLALKLDPNSDVALIQKGALMAEQCYQKDKANAMTDEEKEKCDKESGYYIKKAISLGWRQQTATDREEYLKSVKQEKTRIKKEIK